jgi:hypothetical protein
MSIFKRLAGNLLATALFFALAACGGGGGGGGATAPSDSTAGITVAKSDNSYSLEPTYVIAGDNATVQYWQDEYSGATTQALYSSEVESVKTRVLYDTQTGMPTKIIDELTGNYIVIEDTGSGRVNYYEYDISNNYQQGFAVFVDGDKVYLADIIGKPAFDGQLYGQLTGTSQTGSYTLIADGSSDLENIREADAGFYDAFNAILAAQSTTTAALVGLSIDTGVLSTLGDVLPMAGVALMAGAATTVLAPAYGAAGVAMLISGVAADKLDTWIDNNFTADSDEEQASLDTALSYLVDDAKSSVADLWNDLVDNVSSAQQYVNEQVNNAKDNVDTLLSLDDFSGTVDDELASYNEPQPLDGPPAITTSLIGQAAQQDGTIYTLTGSIDGNGNITASGSSPADSTKTINVSGSKDSYGTVSGTFNTSDGDSGTIDGQEDELGSCQTTTNSGGQGTYSYSHVVGSGSGTVDFTYDAYSIEDAFTVSTSTGQKFSTGGLVSGSETVSISLNDEPIVFISVTAPQSGTAWNYSLGCLVGATTTTTTTTTTTGTTGTAVDQEPNDTAAAAQALGFTQGTVTGTVNSSSDTDDYYAFTPSADGTITVDMAGSGGDLDLAIASADGVDYDSSASTSSTESVSVSLRAGVTYYIQVYAYSTSGADTGYSLTLQ